MALQSDKLQGRLTNNPEAVQRTVDALRAENERRQSCRFCDLMILDMPKHIRICHPPRPAGHRRGATR